MARKFSKTNKAEDIFNKAQQKKESRPEFSIGDKTFYIKPWSHLELWDRLPLVASLFYVPLFVGVNQEEGEILIDQASVMKVLFDGLLDMPMEEFLPDLTSCVHVKSTNEVINLNEDVEKAADICKVLCEVFNNCFLFLFNGGFTEILQLGSEISQVGQMISPDQSSKQ